MRTPTFSLSPKRRARHAFTLIELLVVIAIIAILAAILFPVFAQAREKARQTTCLSNEKQMGLGIIQYIQDFDEMFPVAQRNVSPVPAGGQNYQFWDALVQPYVKNGESDAGATGTGSVFGGIFACPSFPSPSQGRQRNQYGANPGLMPWTIDDNGKDWSGNPTTPPTMALVKAPSDMVMIAEKGMNGDNIWGFPYLTDWCFYWSGGADISTGTDRDAYEVSPGGLFGGPGTMPRYRHAATSNFLFADGHVKSIPRGRLNWQKNIWGNRGLSTADFRGQAGYPFCGIDNYDPAKEP